MIPLSYLYAKIVKKLRGKAINKCKIGNNVVINTGSQVISTQIDRYSYCGYDCLISHATIGSFCSISDHVSIGGGEHPINWVSTSPVFEKVGHSGPSKRFFEHELPSIKQTIIGNDVWIGHAVTIKQGVRIGDGAIIGAGSVVTKDVPAYAIFAGCPAKLIRFRFDNDTIKNLLTIKWWNLNDSDIHKVSPYITEPTIFIEKVQQLRK